MDHRNYHARLRTQMANERTLLSYYRSGLACIGLGAFIFKFYESTFFVVLSALAVVIGIIIVIYGSIRYRKFKQKILSRK
jgi:putative membrane protein